MDENERDIRLFLALNHGHKGIYLDDGEIQCGECGPNWNYRDLPLDTVVRQAIHVLASKVSGLKGLDIVNESIIKKHEAALKEMTESRENWKREWSLMNAAELKAEERVKELTAERDRLRKALGDEKTHSATSDFCSSEWKNDCDELKDLVSRAARIIETVTPGSREEKDEQELWLEDAKAALERK